MRNILLIQVRHVVPLYPNYQVILDVHTTPNHDLGSHLLLQNFDNGVNHIFPSLYASKVFPCEQVFFRLSVNLCIESCKFFVHIAPTQTLCYIRMT